MDSTILPLSLLNISSTFNALTLILFITAFILLIVAIRFNSLVLLSPNNAMFGNDLPGPKPWPVFGSLHLMAKFVNPWDGFAHLKSIYGHIFKITLGSTECVVVNSLDMIRHVLQRGDQAFCGRPNFVRYSAVFGGDRYRSLALCDWSKLQKIRRKLAVPYVFPRTNTHNFNQLESVIESELNDYVDIVSQQCDDNSKGQTPFSKAFFSLVCGNVFFRYFCSKRYSYNDSYFQQMVRRFDDIFHNINNGFALDFLPWLFPFYIIHLAKLYYYGHFIRRFLLNTVINSRIQSWDVDRPKDFLDSILTNTGVCSGNKKPQLSCEYGFYELEDILGGHTAVSSFTTRILVQIAKRPDIQEKIREEIRYVTSTAAKDGVIRLCHRSLMPYTQAVILETLRITASPIIPHVATEDSTLGGYHVKKDSIIFLNNYQLNYSDEYWQEPHTFQPSRFLNDQGQLSKPDHFIPFGSGKRSCLGYQLIQFVSFLTMVKVLQYFDLQSTAEEDSSFNDAISTRIEPAKLAVHDHVVGVSLIQRPKSKLNSEIIAYD